MKAILTFLLFLICLELAAQKDRYRFAESYFGFEAEYSSETFGYISESSRENKNLPSSISPRILIGGTHFWGHADFYISIPLTAIRLKGSDEMHLSNSSFIGFRVLPIQLKNNSLRPYLGLGLNSKELQPKDGPKYSNWQAFYEGGLQYRQNNRILGLSIRYFERNEFNVALNRTQIQTIESSPLSFSLFYSWVIDGTAGYNSSSSKRYMKDIYQRAQENKALNTYSIGIGLNGLIPISQTELASSKPFFNDEIEGNVSPDIGLAYYHAGLDASLRLSFRPLVQKEEAYGYSHKVARYSTALEAFKFIADYHGFVPFVGPFVSHDYYRVSEKDNGKSVLDFNRHKLGYGLVFGWDIRLTKVDYLILRTNLRYSPDYNHEHKGLKFSSEQIEFNFIQVVLYPERLKIYNKNK